MSLHRYTTRQFLPISIEKACEFFSSPQNLALITPPELCFKILTQLKDEEIYEGMKIDYTLKPLFNIPVHWQTVIDLVVPKHLFTDKQMKGPYTKWEHTHFFEQVEGGIIMADMVEYELPLGLMGEVAHRLLIRRKIEYIFEYRKTILTKLFSTHANSVA